MSSEIVIRSTESEDGPSSDTKTPDVTVTSNPFEFAKSWLGYIKTKQFWIVLVFGYVCLTDPTSILTLSRQILSLCITSTNTFSQILANHNSIIPAFQSFFNYVLLVLVWGPILVSRLGGFKAWGRMFLEQGWKCKKPPSG